MDGIGEIVCMQNQLNIEEYQITESRNIYEEGK